MRSGSSNTNRQRLQVLLDSLFYVICISWIGAAGCQPESEVVSVAPGPASRMQLTEGPGGNALTARQSEPLLDGTSSSLAEIDRPAGVTAFSRAKPAEDDYLALGYESKVTPTPERTIPPPATSQVRSLGEILSTCDSTVTPAEPST